MGTFNGIGTFRYGKDDARDDGSYVATEFAVFLMLPVFPIVTERLRLIAIEDRVSLTGGRGVGTTRYEIVERLPLRWSQIGRTYARCWLLVPLVLLWPLLLLILSGFLANVIAGKDAASRFMSTVAPVVAVVAAVYIIAMATYLLYRARRVGLRRS